MKIAIQRAIVGAVLLASMGCGGTKTLMPPRMDLQTYGRIGLVEFASTREGHLKTAASQDFIQKVQAAQPGVPVLELGDQQAVLESIGRDKVDAEAIKAIGKKYDVDALLVGNLEMSGLKPRVGASQILSSVKLQADVEAALTTRLIEARSGATIWTRSAHSKETLANAGVNGGDVYFGVSDPDAKYQCLIQNLVRDITEDFRPYWVKQ